MATIPGSSATNPVDTSTLPSNVGTAVGNAIQTQFVSGGFTTSNTTAPTVAAGGTTIIPQSTVVGAYDVANVSVSGGTGANPTLGVSQGTELVVLTGSGSANIAIGSDKSAVVLGNTGSNNLVYNAGNNVTVAAGSAGGIIGNAATGGGAMNVVLGTGASTVVGSNITATGGSGSNLIGTFGGNNSITAGDGAATIIGGGDKDTIVGGKGDKQLLSSGTSKATTVTAGTGASYLFGGTAATSTSVLVGNVGNDTIFSGKGTATMSGGGGADIFAFASSIGKGGTSTVSDFSLAAGDRISIQGFGLTASQVVANSTVVNGNTVINLGDSTTITLTGVTNLSTSFFV